MKKIIYLHIFLFTILLSSTNVYGKRIPNLVGKWEGVNIKSTLKNGFGLIVAMMMEKLLEQL